MSYEAVNWALAQEVQHSTAKFVLVVMAHHADKDSWESWPSVTSLANSTGQDRKTVVANIARLRDSGFLIDTKKRVGDTKQIPVYLINKEGIAISSSDSKSEKEPHNSTENGTGTENGNDTVFPTNSTVFHLKQSHFSRETVPKTGHGKIKERSEPSKEPSTIRTVIPDWVPADAWKAFVEMRQKIKKPLTEYAKELAVKDLKKLVDAGQDAEDVINQSVLKSWQGFFPLKAVANGTVSRHGGFGNQNYRAGVAEDGSF